MEQPKLQLEAGKYYRTRDGRKAFIVGESPFWDSFKFIGVIEGKGEGFNWKENGAHHPVYDEPTDLVAEWVEPKRIKGWVNVYIGNDPHTSNPYHLDSEHHCGHVYPNRTHADVAAVSSPDRYRIACIEIDVLEGQGLEGGQ